MAANDAAPEQNSEPPALTGAQAVVADAKDPARRPDVLFRVRRDPGHEVSPWWHIGAFVVTTAVVVTLIGLLPG